MSRVHDKHAFEKLALRGLGRFAAAQLRQDGWWALLKTVAGTLGAREPRVYPNRTLGEELAFKARLHGSKVFLDFEEERLSYRELDERAARVARGLCDLGATRGSAVGLFLPNLPAFLEVFFATQRIGACAVPINTALRDEGLAYLLRNAELGWLFTVPSLLPELERLRDRLPPALRIIGVPERAGEPVPPSMIAHETLLAKAPQPEPDGAIPAEHPCMLLYTSGTTGHPKGVAYRYGASQAKMMRYSAHLVLRPGDVYYTCLPLFHANALLVTVVQSLYADARVVLARRFSARNFWNEVRASHATIFNTLGTMVAILMKQPESPLDREHHVRLVLSAACPKDLWEPFQTRFGVPLWETFGAVDGGGFSAFNVGNAPAGSIGKPLGGRIQYRLVDEDGHQVPDGSPGELVHFVGRKQNRQVAYFRNQEATQEKLRDGWLHTGDVMTRDEDGFLYFVGRKTDSIRCRGENISALDVESALDRHPEILESSAYGVPAPLGESDVMVAVVLQPQAKLTPPDLLDFLRDKLPRYALPRHVRFMASLPKTETLRVTKHVLKREGVTPDTWTAAR